MEGIVSLILILSLAAAGFFLYFLPAVIAFNREHNQRVPILILNFFFGWTLLGWVGALIWASTHISKEVRAEHG